MLVKTVLNLKYLVINMQMSFLVLWVKGPIDLWHHFVNAVNRVLSDLRNHSRSAFLILHRCFVTVITVTIRNEISYSLLLSTAF